MSDFDAQGTALLERMDKMLTALDEQIKIAIEKENARLAAIEQRLAIVEMPPITFTDADEHVTTRDLNAAIELLNRDGP